MRGGVELPEHRVDVPEAVAEHDLVVRAAEALDTLSRIETGGRAGLGARVESGRARTDIEGARPW